MKLPDSALDEIIKKLVESKTILQAFWESDTCKRLIESIAEKDSFLSYSSWLYNRQIVKFLYNWLDVPDTEIELLFQALSDGEIVVEREAVHYTEADCVYLKRGLYIEIFHGQGTEIVLVPEKSFVRILEK